MQCVLFCCGLLNHSSSHRPWTNNLFVQQFHFYFYVFVCIVVAVLSRLTNNCLTIPWHETIYMLANYFLVFFYILMISVYLSSMIRQMLRMKNCYVFCRKYPKVFMTLNLLLNSRTRGTLIFCRTLTQKCIFLSHSAYINIWVFVPLSI